VAEDDPDIILLTETWCTNEITNAELALDSYNLEADLRKDRTDTHNGLGGGLLVYCKLGLALRNNDKLNNIDFNQYCAFSIMSEKPINIILTYRPPNSGRENLLGLCELLQTAAADNTIAIGDYNLPDVDWLSNRAGGMAKHLLHNMQQNNYEQLINFPTHDKGNILDLVVTNRAEKILSTAEGGKLGNSDHSIIEIVVDIGRKKRPRHGKLFAGKRQTSYK
jgi:Endonuclease-reverse transcriptase